MDQTFTDFELILIDDGSTEDYRTEIPSRDPRIRYYRQEHKGASAARNSGIREAQGRYIAFLDSDDVFLPEKLQEQVSCMEKNPETAFTHTSYLRIESTGAILREVHSGKFSGKVYPRILAYCPIATPTVMIRADALWALSFEEKISVAEDIILWSKIAKKSRILGINKALTKIRVHPGSTINNQDFQIQAIKNLMEYAINPDKELGFFSKMKILSTMHSYYSSCYYRKRLFGKAFRSAVLAFVYCPINPDLYLPKIKVLFRERFLG
jgi:hypothetical protein